jgi:hypothetical protein
VILVVKTIDADGNLETEDDQTAGEGWEFQLDLEDGDIEEAFPVTDADGIGGWLFTLPIDGTNASVTEMIQDNFDLIDAFCVDAGSLAAPEALRSRIDAEGDIVGELDGDSVSFPVEAETAYICFFANSPEPEDSVGGETATPEITLPPTDAFGGPQAPSNESWRIMLVVLAGILASALILTPSPATRRK